MEIRRSCLCGTVRFVVTGPIQQTQACHCSRCRRFYGAANGPIAIVASADFAYESGEDSIASYASSERVNRYLCRTCASPLPIAESWDPLVGIPLGVLDDEPEMKLGGHIFVGSKAAWHDIVDDTPQHESWPDAGKMEERFTGLAK